MHTMIIGQTGSGKSYLAQWLCRSIRGKLLTMVLDPLCSPEWGRSGGSHFVTASTEAFCRMAFRVRDAVLFVDECGQTVGLHPSPEMEKVATMSRHQGHRVYFIGQRGTQINRTMRDQTSTLYLFNVNRKDAEEWAETYNDAALLAAPSLRPRHFIVKKRFKPAIFCGPIPG